MCIPPKKIRGGERRRLRGLEHTDNARRHRPSFLPAHHIQRTGLRKQRTVTVRDGRRRRTKLDTTPYALVGTTVLCLGKWSAEVDLWSFVRGRKGWEKTCREGSESIHYERRGGMWVISFFKVVGICFSLKSTPFDTRAHKNNHLSNRDSICKIQFSCSCPCPSRACWHLVESATCRIGPAMFLNGQCGSTAGTQSLVSRKKRPFRSARVFVGNGTGGS